MPAHQVYAACSDLHDNPQTNEDFSFLIWREVFRSIANIERQAVEISQTVELEIKVSQFTHHPAEQEVTVFRAEVVCEPGKRPRLAKTQLTERGASSLKF